MSERAYLRERPDGPFQLVDCVRINDYLVLLAVKAASPSFESVRAAARLLYPSEDPMWIKPREDGFFTSCED